MRLAAMLALAVVTVSSCYNDGYSPDGGDGGVLATYMVSGTVAGAGNAKATMTLRGAVGAPQTTTSSDTGGYQFLSVAPGEYTLTVSKKGFTYTPPSQAVKVVSKAVAVPVITSVGAQNAYAVSGTVSGDVMLGVKLTLWSAVKSYETATDAAGAYSIPNPTAGTYTLTPSLTGYTFSPPSRSVTVTGAAITTQDFTASVATYAVSGTVSGDVKLGVKLTLSKSGKSFEATTDAAGVYSIPNAPDGTYTLTPSLTGYTFSPPSRSVTVAGAAITTQDFTANAVPYAVSGAVSGDVKAGVKLTLSATGKSFEATTDAAGAYSIPNATAGTYTLTPSLTGYTFSPPSRSVTVAGAAITTQDFTANAVPYAVSGTVSGDVKLGVKLTLSATGKSFEATTDAAGVYSIPNATAGTYTLTPSLTGYTFSPPSRSVTVAGAAITAQDFTASVATYAVSGAVSGDVKAGVKLTLSATGKSFEATTDTAGAYSIPNATAGTYTLTPSLAGYTFLPASRSVTVTGAAITAQGFTANAVRFAVSGTVSGDVKAAVTLTLSNSVKTLTATTDAAGAYSIPNATAGTYTLTPSLAGYSFLPASRSVTVSGAAIAAQDFGGVALGWKARSPAGNNVRWAQNAMSSDGKYLAAVSGTNVYVSSDYGASWRVSTVGLPSGNSLKYIAMSNDGKFIATVSGYGHVYVSSDFGATWPDKSTGVIANIVLWKSIDISDNGKIIAAVAHPGHLYVSTNSGENWEDKSSGVISGDRLWGVIVMSGNGQYMAAAVQGGHMYTSDNSGVSWQDRSLTPIDDNLVWDSIAMSSDGRYLAATVFYGNVFTSGNFGASWKNNSSGVIATRRDWYSVAISNDGMSLAAVVNNGHVYTSSNSGDTWEDKSSGIVSGDIRWQSVSSSGDGRYIAAIPENGLLYTYASP